MSVDAQEELESRINRWRAYVLAHGGAEADLAVVEGELRNHAVRLGDSGLNADEAFLLALRPWQ